MTYNTESSWEASSPLGASLLGGDASWETRGITARRKNRAVRKKYFIEMMFLLQLYG